MEWEVSFMVPVAVTILQFILAVESATSVFDTACSFEIDLCDWTSANLNRSRYAHDLAHADRTGPKQAEDGDFYIYLDTGKGTREGSLTRESLMVPSGSGDVCLSFWYHMFGETMGRLNVSIDDTVVWTKAGNQSNIWHCATVDIATLQSKISFEASRGRDIYSIIALDNIAVLNTKCIQENCESLRNLTTSTTESSQSPTSQRTTESPVVTNSEASSTKINLEAYIPYIAGVPAGILVVGAVTLCVCLRKQKLTKRRETILVTPNQYNDLPRDDTYNTINYKEEEVYTYIDEGKMIRTDSENNPYDDAHMHQSSGHTNQVDVDYEEPSKLQEQSVGNQGRSEKDDYITPTSRRSDVISADDYITPTNEHDGPRKMSIKTESFDLKEMHRASITSAEAEVDNFDYLVLSSTKGKKGGANLAFSLKE